MDFFFFLNFSSLRFHLLGCGNQQGCVPNDILLKLFAALIPRVKANQRRVQKWRTVFWVFFVDFIFPN